MVTVFRVMLAARMRVLVADAVPEGANDTVEVSSI